MSRDNQWMAYYGWPIIFASDDAAAQLGNTRTFVTGADHVATAAEALMTWPRPVNLDALQMFASRNGTTPTVATDTATDTTGTTPASSGDSSLSGAFKRGLCLGMFGVDCETEYMWAKRVAFVLLALVLLGVGLNALTHGGVERTVLTTAEA